MAKAKVGKLLKIYMDIEEVTTRDMAKEIGVSPATISRITRGEKFDVPTMFLLLGWLFGKGDGDAES